MAPEGDGRRHPDIRLVEVGEGRQHEDGVGGEGTDHQTIEVQHRLEEAREGEVYPYLGVAIEEDILVPLRRWRLRRKGRRPQALRPRCVGPPEQAASVVQ